MIGAIRASRACSALMLGAVVSCGFFRSEQSPPQPMPAIQVFGIVRTPGDSTFSLAPTPSLDPIANLGASKRVSLNAKNADARTLLLWLARESGVDLSIAPDVNARVSVSFDNVPAADAMRAIIAEARLSVLAPGLRSPWPPVVFHQVPVNIKVASAEAIVARFGVSAEMAKWLVESAESVLPITPPH